MYSSKTCRFFPTIVSSSISLGFTFKCSVVLNTGHLEEENDRLHAQLKIVMEEREVNQLKLKEIMDENAKLQTEKQDR